MIKQGIEHILDKIQKENDPLMLKILSEAVLNLSRAYTEIK